MIYSSLKAAWHLDKIKELRETKKTIPSQVQLVLSDLCNQDCNFCGYRSSLGFSSENFSENGNHNPNRKIPFEIAKLILEECQRLGVKAIQFTGGGEPTVHPQHRELIALAQDLGLKTGLVTNGILIKPDPCFEKLDWVRVSLDAGSYQTYHKIRKSTLFHKALENLDYLTKHCKMVGVGFVVTPDNYFEINLATLLAKKANYIRFSAVFSTVGQDLYKEIYLDIKERINEAKKEETDTFKVFDLFGDRIDDLKQGRPDYSFCGYQHFNTYIGGNQKIYRCCTTAYTKRGEIGHIKDGLIPEKNNFDAKGCHHCQFNNQNKVINYLLDEPLHVDFV